MMSAGELDSSTLTEKSDGRRGRLRARVDAGQSRSLPSAGVCESSLRAPAWFSAGAANAATPVTLLQPPLTPLLPFQPHSHFVPPFWWMSSGLLASRAPCPSSVMGVSQLERLAGAGPAVNNIMLRDILAARADTHTPPTSVDMELNVASTGKRFNSAATAVDNNHHDDNLLQPADSSQQQQQQHLDEDADGDDALTTSRAANLMHGSPDSPTTGVDKKGRLETIVSGMRHECNGRREASPPPVNGCKKRKLYQPMQHEVRTSGGESEREEADYIIDDEEDAESVAGGGREDQSLVDRHVKRVKNQLELMHERYAHLYRSGINAASINREVQQHEMDLSVRSANQTPEAESPEKMARDERPLPALHRIAEKQAPTAFMDYARRMFNADTRHKGYDNAETEKTPARSVNDNISDINALAQILKSELASSLSGLVDEIFAKWLQQRKYQHKSSATDEDQTETYNQQVLEQRCSPRSEFIRRISQQNARFHGGHPLAPPEGVTPFSLSSLPHVRSSSAIPNSVLQQVNNNSNSSKNQQGLAMAAAAAAAALGNNAYNSAYSLQMLRDSIQQQQQQQQEQGDGPLSLVVTPKKKRHKVTDARALSRACSNAKMYSEDVRANQQVTSSGSPSPCAYSAASGHPASVAVSHSSLQETREMFGAYQGYYKSAMVAGGTTLERRESDDLSPHPPSGAVPTGNLAHHTGLLHPTAALMAVAAGAGQNSPDSMGYMRETPDRTDVTSIDGSMYDSIHNTIGFAGKLDGWSGLSLISDASSTLTPMHLRKAKLMFFWSRYPSSSILKSYFPDINFNKNNTAQLVKWFSNFREFFYIQMEKYARQALSEGVTSAEQLTVTTDCQLLRVLNLHYNRNNHSEIPPNFPFVGEAALREFFKAIQSGKDAEPSWKKAIYKVIARLDECIPDYFRSPGFLEQL